MLTMALKAKVWQNKWQKTTTKSDATDVWMTD
jgi:hypothetical protein